MGWYFFRLILWSGRATLRRNLNGEELARWKSEECSRQRKYYLGLEGTIQCPMMVMYEFIRNKAFVHSFIDSLTHSFNRYILSSSDVPGTVPGVGL